MRRIVLAALVALLFSCSTPKEKVDTIVVNANIYTVDSNFSKQESLAIRNGTFVAIGTTEEIQGKYISEQKIDAGGRTIVPGLIDAHCHFYGLGLNQQVVDLVGTKSYAEVLERVKAFQQKNKARFVQGRGWDQNDWENKEFPTKKELDIYFPNTPVVLERVDGHAYLVNQTALDLAGITDLTKIRGGEIVKKSGHITGILVDGPMKMIDAILPEPSRKVQIRALKDAERICLHNGLTTVNDAGLDRATIELIDSLQQAGDLSIKIYAMVSNTKENLEYYLNKGIVKTNKLDVRSIKVYADGALGSRGAALRASYSDQPGHFGAMVTPVNNIEALAKRIAGTKHKK